MRLSLFVAAAMLSTSLAAPANASGTVLIQEFNTYSGTGGPTNCCEEFTNGALTYRAEALPGNFTADDGTPCASPALSPEGGSVCDGDFQVFGESRQVQ